MLAIVALAAITLVGLLIVGVLALRAGAQARHLHAQVRMTRSELEPRYQELRRERDNIRPDAPKVTMSRGRTIDGAGGAGERG